MAISRGSLLLGTALLSACVGPSPAPRFVPLGGNFATFAEDEDTCRKAGAAAIKDAADDAMPAGPRADASAAYHYDDAYRRCMFFHGRSRMLGATARDAAPDMRENLHGEDYPDAFYSVPYATPGYGYDGYSY